jgi:hypothetical protein
MNKWQPIETAPKDGTLILIWVKHEVGPDMMMIAKFHTEYDEPADDPSERLRWKEEAGFYNVRATHWMPLPEPPK